MKLYRSVLIVDDETRWLRAMAVTLRQEVPEAKVHCCENSRQALDMVEQADADLVLLDLNMPHLGGEELLAQIRKRSPFTRIIVVTGVNDTATAVRCVKHGAYDFFVKGGRPEQLIACIRRALEVAALESNYRQMTHSFLTNARNGALPGVLSQSSKMRDCCRYASALTDSPYPIVVAGEGGTGKRQFACALGQLISAEQPPLEYDCKSAEDELTRLLFGQVRGAFDIGEPAQLGLFEQHHGQVIVLNGLFELPQKQIQPVINALLNRQYCPLGGGSPQLLPCKVIVLTQRPLTQLVSQGLLTQAQYLALETHQIQLPPLRERPEDTGLLATHFIGEASTHFGKRLAPLNIEVIQQLEQETWPGNVTELRARIFHAVALSKEGEICLPALLDGPEQAKSAITPQYKTQFPTKLPTLSEIQQELIHEALKRCKYNQSDAAQLLGISQSTLSRRLRATG